jgi:hypothetical protein
MGNTALAADAANDALQTHAPTNIPNPFITASLWRFPP